MFKFYSRSNTTKITNFILDEIKRSISISVYYGWKRSIQNGRWQEIDLKIIFWLQISYSPHSGTNTNIKWDMYLSILNIILKYAVGTCLWLYWKLTLHTHFLLDFIYFHETIDISFIICLFFRSISALIIPTPFFRQTSLLFHKCLRNVLISMTLELLTLGTRTRQYIIMPW